MGNWSDFQRGQTVGARLAVVSVTGRPATSLAVSTAAVPKVMTAYSDRGKTSSAERSCGRKPKLSERDRRTLQGVVYKNDHRTDAAKVTAELSIHPEDAVSTKTALPELHKSSNTNKRRKRWCDDDKSWTSDVLKHNVVR
jgi:hypothetical protein